MDRNDFCTTTEFAMPTYGRTAESMRLVKSVRTGIDVPVRGGHVATLAAGTAQGTPVWRPPDC